MPGEGDSGLDGPAPKALPEDTSDVGLGEDGMPLNPGGGDHAVQFIPQGKDPNNGDAKVDLGDAVGGVPKFVGLGKEELMKYANDPFWVRLRWILFILFWILWVAMLAGAIVIIVLAPKCSGMTEVTKEVVKDGPYYQIYLKSFAPNAVNKFAGLEEKAQYIQDLGVRTVIISQFWNTSDFETIDTAIYRESGNSTTFKTLVAALKERGIKVLLQVIPNHASKTHKWFTSNPEYYVLKNTDEVTESTWKSQYNEPAWTPIPNTNKSYLHQFQESEPDFDFNNKDLVKELNNVLKFWYKEADIVGFLISDVSYLLEDFTDLKNPNNTVNQPGNKKVIEELLDSSTWDLGERSAPYALLDVDGLSAAEAIKQYGSTRVMPVVSDLNTDLKPGFTAKDLKNKLEEVDVNSQFVLRRLSSPRLERPTAKFGNGRADILQMVTLVLRGEVVVYYGEELGLGTSSPSDPLNKNVAEMQFNRDTNNLRASYNFFKALVDLHKNINQTAENKEEKTILYAENEIFAFKRENHVFVANFNSQNQDVDLDKIFGIKGNGTVVSVSPTPFPENESKQLASTFMIQPFQGYVLAYGTA